QHRIANIGATASQSASVILLNCVSSTELTSYKPQRQQYFDVGSKQFEYPKNLKQTMKMAYFIIGLILSVGIVFYLTSCENKQNSKQGDNYVSKSSDTVKVHTVPDNRFLDLRNMALNVTPEQLQLSLPTDQTKVFGVVMDWDLGDGTMTLITYQTGDASMYLSSGGGVIGGGQHESVSKASKEFVSMAQNYLAKSSKADTTTLPEKDCFKFYFLTNKGKFVAQENIGNIENKTSKWLSLFENANNVITELRLTTEKK
ncbi:MAG: hypothetical protein WAT19_05860, partial [Ferruginibacter sp.]